jgi:hypothetical protein
MMTSAYESNCESRESSKDRIQTFNKAPNFISPSNKNIVQLPFLSKKLNTNLKNKMERSIYNN